MIRPAPASRAPWIAASPTAPQPITITVSPQSIRRHGSPRRSRSSPRSRAGRRGRAASRAGTRIACCAGTTNIRRSRRDTSAGAAARRRRRRSAAAPSKCPRPRPLRQKLLAQDRLRAGAVEAEAAMRVPDSTTGSPGARRRHLRRPPRSPRPPHGRARRQGQGRAALDHLEVGVAERGRLAPAPARRRRPTGPTRDRLDRHGLADLRAAPPPAPAASPPPSCRPTAAAEALSPAGPDMSPPAAHQPVHRQAAPGAGRSAG